MFIFQNTFANDKAKEKTFPFFTFSELSTFLVSLENCSLFQKLPETQRTQLYWWDMRSVSNKFSLSLFPSEENFLVLPASIDLVCFHNSKSESSLDMRDIWNVYGGRGHELDNTCLPTLTGVFCSMRFRWII